MGFVSFSESPESSSRIETGRSVARKAFQLFSESPESSSRIETLIVNPRYADYIETSESPESSSRIETS